jgi:hypothetical protein
MGVWEPTSAHFFHDSPPNQNCRERAITANTVMLYASAPTFGQGVIDPVAAIGALGRKYDVGAYVRVRGLRKGARMGEGGP